MDIGSAVGDIFLPRTCVVCGKRLLLRERFLCLPCAADLPLTYFWTVDHNPMADKLNALIERRLSAAVPSGSSVATGSSSAAGLLSGAEPYARAAALFYYNSQAPYRKIPQALKYQGAVRSGRHFARMLGRHLAGSSLYADVDLVIPVPLHWTRRWQRGYNQAAVIAREVASALGVPMEERLLRRRRRTRTRMWPPSGQERSPWRMAFSTRGCKMNVGTTTPSRAGSEQISMEMRSPYRVSWSSM